MADLNYMNPNGLDPGVGFKPEGLLGGMEWAKRDKLFRDANSLQDIMSRNSAAKSTMELGEFERDSGVRLDQQLAKQAEAQATQAYAMREKGAGVTKSEIENFKSGSTMHSDIAAKLSDNALKQGQNGLTQLQLGRQKLTELALTAGSIGGMGPASGAQRGQMLAQSGIDPNSPLGQHFMNSQDFVKDLKQMTQNFVDADEKAQATIRNTQEHNKGTMAVAKEHSRSAMAVAQMKQQQIKTGIKAALESFYKGKIPDERMLDIYRAAQANPEVEPVDMAQIRAAAEQANRNIQTKAQNDRTKNPSLPGMPQPGAAQSPLGGGAPNPSAGGATNVTRDSSGKLVVSP